ncbi:sigma factor-like helix-turn-helix DNA-binding protein [Sphingomonas faeni]|uniref:sigma factor-like helix-turn-helix DNA-binding protein n=1 Tax=Sphingomonas faeni TaxID=185950 RepID=UPI00335D2BC7
MTAGRIDQLTEAQRACLRLVLTHHNSKEIAAVFGVSPSAIDKRIERAIQVLGVGTRFEAARRLEEHERGATGRSAPDRKTLQIDEPMATYERLPSEPIDVPIPPSDTPDSAQIEPWGLARRFFGMSEAGGSTGVARNRFSVGDRMVRLIALMGLIAVTSMALVNMAMTLNSLLRSNRDRNPPVHGAATTAPSGRTTMLKQRRDATDKVTVDFLKAEAAVDHAAMLAASCVSTLLQQRVAANLPVGTGVMALQMISQASLDMINARQRFVEAHRALVAVRAEIGLGQFYGYGDTAECPPNEGALRADGPVRLAAVA